MISFCTKVIRQKRKSNFKLPTNPNDFVVRKKTNKVKKIKYLSKGE